jgi:hypothetical protein
VSGSVRLRRWLASGGAANNGRVLWSTLAFCWTPRGAVGWLFLEPGVLRLPNPALRRNPKWVAGDGLRCQVPGLVSRRPRAGLFWFHDFVSLSFWHPFPLYIPFPRRFDWIQAQTSRGSRDPPVFPSELS